MAKNELKIIEETVKTILNLMDINDFALKVEKKEELINLDLQSPDSALLIGRYGEKIASLQLILGIMTYQRLGKWQKIILNVNSWRETREEYLKNMALNFAQKVKFSAQALKLPFLSPAERRVIHLYLSDHPDVETYSEGEGSQRRLVIKLREKKTPKTPK